MLPHTATFFYRVSPRGGSDTIKTLNVSICLVQPIGRGTGRVEAGVGGRWAEAIGARDVLRDAAAEDEQIAEEQRGLHVVVGLAAAVGSDLVAVARVLACNCSPTITRYFWLGWSCICCAAREV